MLKLNCKCAQYDLSCRRAIKHHPFIPAEANGNQGTFNPQDQHEDENNLAHPSCSLRTPVMDKAQRAKRQIPVEIVSQEQGEKLGVLKGLIFSCMNFAILSMLRNKTGLRLDMFYVGG